MRRLACLAGAAGALALPGAAPAVAAPEPRIINGTTTAPGEYEAQGYLQLMVSSDETYSCGGTLISARHFLTAAHCATNPDTGAPLPPSAFTVRLGSPNRDSGGTVHTISRNQVHENYDAGTFDNDAAVLTLATAASATLSPLRLIRTSETALWEPGDPATVIGWGKTDNTPTNDGSDALREAQVPIRSDADCGALIAYGSDFHRSTMVCAGDGSADTCAGDSGGPLMVHDGAAYALVGITSWGDVVCNHPTRPGVYTRLGAPALNAWVRGRRAELDFAPASATAGQPVTFTATSQGGGGYAWDLDGDGQFDDAAGASAARTFAAAGRFPVGLRASDAEGQAAEHRETVAVAAAPTPQPTPPAPTAGPSPAPVVQPVPMPRERLATILVTGRPKVRRGRFLIRIRFARTAPRGTAVVEVYRGRRLAGIARTRVARDATKRVRVKLTRTGQRLLRRSAGRRLKVRVRVRVGRTVLRSRTLTIRR